MGWSIRYIKILVVILFLPVFLVSYQNCSPSDKDNSNGRSQLSVNGNGSPYEGKILSSLRLCDDLQPFLKIKITGKSSALLLKDNCKILSDPSPIKSSDLDLTNLTYLDYQLQVEENVQNKIAFVQNSLTFHPDPAVALTTNPMAIDISPGSLMICTILYLSPTVTSQVQSVTDNLGNTYVAATSPFGESRSLGNAGYVAEVWYAENVQGGPNMQATFDLGEPFLDFSSTRCYEYTGILPTNSLDQVHQGYSSVVNNVINIGPYSTTWSNELVFVAYFGVEPLTSFGAYTPVEGEADGAMHLFTTTPLHNANIEVLTNTDRAIAVVSFRGVE